MKKGKLALIILAISLVSLAAPAWWFGVDTQRLRKLFDRAEPDLPKDVARAIKREMGMENYLIKRGEQFDLYQGFDTAEADSRPRAVREIERQERILGRKRAEGIEAPALAWTPLGPDPLPISATNAYSGRTSAIAVHPTNPDIAYVGTAQGGLYRTLNGGGTWTPLMDGAETLAIGAVALAPSQPTTLYVGTGESTQCGSGCYIGVGVYRIENADSPSPVITGPLNKNGGNADVLTGRAISEILVHQIDPNTIFLGTTSGIAGIGSTTVGLNLPPQGVYRSTNGGTAFEKIELGISNRNVTDLVMDPLDPNRVWAGVIGDPSTGGGGVYMTANALDPVPSFSQVLSTALTGAQSRVELTANRVGTTTTVLAASGQGTGTLYRSVNHAPFTPVVNNNFCNPQCFYDIAVAMDPNNANNIYLGGSPAMVFGRSANGGATAFTNSSGIIGGGSLHVDTQVITVAPSSPNIIYFGSDGGIWRSVNSGISWTTLNKTAFSATQFMGISVHPSEANYTLGGTQDNGTELYTPQGTWLNSDGGDGGFSVIDQTTTGLTDVVAYHTYFNQTTTQIGFNRGSSPDPSTGDPFWATFLGCGTSPTVIPNGISCTDATLFYAPMVGGPTAGDSAGKNTLYFGTDKLYRSANLGTTMTPVSQALTGIQSNGQAERVSAIGIAPSNDAVRLIGSTTGRVYYSNAPGATTMTDVTGTVPARYVARIGIHPTNPEIAYVALNGYGIPNQHVMKTTDLSAGVPTWTNAGTGIPDVPTNALIIDPDNPNVIYAGTDIGVYRSQDSGATWVPFGTGLPRVAVFGMAIQNPSRTLRIATHGKGMWQISINIPINITISGRVVDQNGRGVTNAAVVVSDPDGLVRTAITNRNGGYALDNIPSGRTYTVSVRHGRFSFGPPQTVTPFENVGNVDFTAQ